MPKDPAEADRELRSQQAAKEACMIFLTSDVIRKTDAELQTLSRRQLVNLRDALAELHARVNSRLEAIASESPG